MQKWFDGVKKNLEVADEMIVRNDKFKLYGWRTEYTNAFKLVMKSVVTEEDRSKNLIVYRFMQVEESSKNLIVYRLMEVEDSSKNLIVYRLMEVEDSNKNLIVYRLMEVEGELLPEVLSEIEEKSQCDVVRVRGNVRFRRTLQ